MILCTCNYFYIPRRVGDKGSSVSTEPDKEETKGSNSTDSGVPEKHGAWEEKRESSDSSDGPELLYTYEDCARLLYRLFFVFFSFLNILVTVVCFSIVSAGGASSN